MLSRKSIIDVSLLVIVNAMWAAQYAAYKEASEKMGPVTLTFWVFVFAATALLPFRIWERRLLKGIKFGERIPESGRSNSWTRGDLIGFCMLSILGLLPGSILLAWGEDLTTASDAALIYLTVPIMTAVMAVLILRERMTIARWGSLIVSLTGVLVLSNFNWHHLELTDKRFLVGNSVVLLACAGSSFYNVYSKRLLKRFTPLEVLIYSYLLAALIAFPLLRWREPLSLAAIREYGFPTWISILICALLSYGLAMVLWMVLLTRLDVSQVSISIYLLPFLGVLIAAMTLKEKITPSMMLGGAITLVGTILATIMEKSA